MIRLRGDSTTNDPLESEEGVPIADMIHWCHPSAEMVAESREVEP